jgi:hypothetical protein
MLMLMFTIISTPPPLLHRHECDSSDDEGGDDDDEANKVMLLQEDRISLVDCRYDFDAYRSSHDSGSKHYAATSASTTPVPSLADNMTGDEDATIASPVLFSPPLCKADRTTIALKKKNEKLKGVKESVLEAE